MTLTPVSTPPPERLDTPVALPKFTFLWRWPEDSARDFAASLATADPAVGIFDFATPIHRATIDLFFEGDVLFDLTPSTKIRVHRASFSRDDWLALFTKFLRTNVSAGILGHIAMSELESSGLSLSMFERFLFRDLTDARDLAPFTDKFPVAECLILCRSNDTPISPIRTLTLASGSTHDAITSLRRLLGATP